MTATQIKGKAKNMNASEPSKTYSPLEIVTPFDRDGDDRDYKWVEIRDAMEIKSNVINARWMPEKIMPMFQDLDAPKLLSDRHRPTKFCAQVLYRYNVYCNGDKFSYDLFKSAYQEAYSKEAEEVVIPEFLDDEGDVTGDDKTITGDDKGASIDLYQEKARDGRDDLEGRFLALQKLQSDVEGLKTQLAEVEQRDWENQVIADELGKREEKLKKEKEELELRLKIRQMLDKAE